MFCENCGKELSPGAKFCEFCGAPVQAEGAPAAAPGPAPAEYSTAGSYAEPPGAAPAGGQYAGPPGAGPQGAVYAAPPGTAPAGAPYAEHSGDDEAAISGMRVTENVYLCPDGKYRWSYAFDMLKNPVILFTTWKVLGLSALIVVLFTALMALIEGSFGLPDSDNMKIIVILVIVLFVLSIIAYLVVAGSYGWKYLVLFEMDEDGVMHRQMKNQFKKAQAMGWIAAVAAAAAGRPGMAGAGMLAATRNSMYSDFKRVRKVKVNRAMHTIYVNELLGRNQVYAETADFDFVLHFIKEHTGK